MDTSTVFDVDYGPSDFFCCLYGDDPNSPSDETVHWRCCWRQRNRGLYEWCAVSAEHQGWLSLEVVLHHSGQQTSGQWTAWLCSHTSLRRTCSLLKHGYMSDKQTKCLECTDTIISLVVDELTQCSLECPPGMY